MDKGSAGYTEYEFNEDFIAYLYKHPEKIEMNIGHIHSHNNMQTFFSGEDRSELETNCEKHNMYLSLIVNNKLEMTAKLVFVGSNEVNITAKRTYTNSQGELKVFNTATSSNEKVMFEYDCNISTPFDCVVDDDFIKRTDEIIEEARKAVIVNTQNRAYYGGSPYNSYNYNYDRHLPDFNNDDYRNGRKSKSSKFNDPVMYSDQDWD